MTDKNLLPAPKSAEEAFALADILAKSQMVPKAFQNKPYDIVVAMMWGKTLDIPIVQSLQHIAVINGKPSMYGDGLLAVVMASGQLIDIKEEVSGEDLEIVARCTIKRRGKESPVVSVFTAKDAKKAGLYNKPGPWQQYPKRMCQMRARAFALRDAFPDVLSGMSSAEEMQDVVDTQGGDFKDDIPSDQAPARKRPRRKSAKAESAAALEHNPQPTADFVPEVIEPEAAPIPVEEPAPAAESAETAQPEDVSEDAGEPVVDIILNRIHSCESRAELVALWRELTVAERADADIVGAFRKRQVEVDK